MHDTDTIEVLHKQLDSRTVAYSGHGANTGGLQRHSLGDDYPFVVVGVSFDDTPGHKYYVINGCTGYQGEIHDTYEECVTEIAWQKLATEVRDKCRTVPAYRLGFIYRNTGAKNGNPYSPRQAEYGQFGAGAYDAIRIAAFAEICIERKGILK